MHLRQPLTRYRLQKIIGTRETDLLETDPPATLEQLEAYAEGTASQLLQLQVGFRQGFCIGSRVQQRRPSRHCGIAETPYIF